MMILPAFEEVMLISWDFSLKDQTKVNWDMQEVKSQIKWNHNNILDGVKDTNSLGYDSNRGKCDLKIIVVPLSVTYSSL